jgi:hypothetical protein
MKHQRIIFSVILLISLILATAVFASAQDSTEIWGYYSGYRNFDFKSGFPPFDVQKAKLNGGGFGFAYNLAPWFAMWTQFTFYGSAQAPSFDIRVINNLQGVRYQTRQYGPLRFYVKGGLGFSNFSLAGVGFTKFSAGYGVGAQIWMTNHIGLVLDGSHIAMGLPNLTDLEGRETWDSGLVFAPGISIRF